MEKSDLMFPTGIYSSNTKNPNVTKISINFEKLKEWFENNPEVINEKGYTVFVCAQITEEKKAEMQYPKDTTIYFNPDYVPNNAGSNTSNVKSVKPKKSKEEPNQPKLTYREQMALLEQKQQKAEGKEKEEKPEKLTAANWRAQAGLPEDLGGESGLDDLPF